MRTADSDIAALSAALGSQYQVIRLLGRGGMGAVYQAHEVFLDRDVAVKVLPADLASGEARDRFLREARTAARLSHPNIVPLHSFGEAGALLYYIMGFVDGESLETRLRREGRLSFDESRRITSEVASALDYAHQLGIVHRDVKPDNILLERGSGRALLADFGIAKQRAGGETLTQTGIVVGTPHYMSPEQASGDRELDGRADIYALGVIAYRMIAGRLPFEGHELQSVLAQHATRRPTPLDEMTPGVPIDLVGAVGRALAKDPAHRWPTAGMMAQALSADSDEFIPDELLANSGMGVRTLILSAAIVEGAFLIFVFGGLESAPAWFLGLTALGVQVVSSLVLVRLARRFGRDAALAAWFQQPRWWSGWWPRVARRSRDVWDRLPDVVRAGRRLSAPGAVAAAVSFNFVVFVARADFLAVHPNFLRSSIALPVIAGWTLLSVGPQAMALRRFMRWRKANGLSQRDATRFLTEPTSSSAFWRRPDIAALLDAAPARTPAMSASRAPDELAREIAALARQQQEPNADVYREAAGVAEDVCAAIAGCDEALQQLRRDADPAQRQRVQASLDALGAASGGEAAAIAQMRELLRRQLDAFQDLDARRVRLEDRRTRLAEQLQALALQLAQLRADAAGQSAGADDITARIRALRRSVEHRLEAQGEVSRILG